MKQITEFTDDAKQHHTLVLESDGTVDFTLYFNPRSENWTFDLIYNDIKIYGAQFVLSNRLLRQWANFIDFDIMVVAVDGQDPFRLDDFSSNRINVFLLNSNDVQLVEKNIYYE